MGTEYFLVSLVKHEKVELGRHWTAHDHNYSREEFRKNALKLYEEWDRPTKQAFIKEVMEWMDLNAPIKIVADSEDDFDKYNEYEVVLSALNAKQVTPLDLKQELERLVSCMRRELEAEQVKLDVIIMDPDCDQDEEADHEVGWHYAIDSSIENYKLECCKILRKKEYRTRKGS